MLLLLSIPSSFCHGIYILDDVKELEFFVILHVYIHNGTVIILFHNKHNDAGK